MWFVFGGVSFILAMCSLWCAVYRPKRVPWVSVCSLSFLALTLLSECAMIKGWVECQDWSALLDVVPYMNGILTGYVVGIILVNMAAMLLCSHAKNREQ